MQAEIGLNTTWTWGIAARMAPDGRQLWSGAIAAGAGVYKALKGGFSVGKFWAPLSPHALMREG